MAARIQLLLKHCVKVFLCNLNMFIFVNLLNVDNNSLEPYLYRGTSILDLAVGFIEKFGEFLWRVIQ